MGTTELKIVSILPGPYQFSWSEILFIASCYGNMITLHWGKKTQKHYI